MRLSVSNLSCLRDGKSVLEALSFDLEAGQIGVVLGPNGAGKSTLLHCLTGNLPFLSGQVELDGRPLSSLSRAELSAAFALLSQDTPAMFPYQVMDVVLMGRVRHFGWFESPNHQDAKKAIAMLEFVDANHLKKRNFNTLSRGEKQRVLMARTLVQESDILLLDEPTSHLDFASQFRFVELIRQAAKTLGKGVLIVMHDPNLAMRLADHVILLCKGRGVAMGAPSQVLTPANLEIVYQLPIKQVSVDGITLVAPFSP